MTSLNCTILPPLELWGGHECTINRVGDGFQDQSERTGHYLRSDDLARFASLGLSHLRYPILWETVSPGDPTECHWRSSDDAMGRMRALGLGIIAGLVHHGSGPAYTNLLSETFAPGVAAHAGRVAERYPWICDWTPINEPLTTARFAALYGLWYPHVRDERSFWLALLNQVDAVRLSMQAIRRIVPDARLVQTEDVGRTFGTAAVADQVRFDNMRRWASLDLLCGGVTACHPLYARMSGFGFQRRLDIIAAAPCPPGVIGINHYLTSDRYLDDVLERHPPESHGSNGRQCYADVAAAGVPECEPTGLAGAIGDTWARYQLPVALTEIHNGCTREEQMRWLNEAWKTAHAARAAGSEVIGMTAWSLLGAYDWTSLLTEQRGEYESGVWDIRSTPPRETALAPLLRSIATGTDYTHPALAGTGWWQHASPAGSRRPNPVARDRRPILITGATGTLGQAIAGACRLRNLAFRTTSRQELPLGDPAMASQVLEDVKPWLVINAAGWVRVDDAEGDPLSCMSANRDGAVELARACTDRNIPFVGFSSDLVFSGEHENPYVEADRPAPLSVYGRSKAEADRLLCALEGPILIVRTAAFFSPFDDHNFAMHLMRALRRRSEFSAASDVVVTPTYVPDLVRTTLDLAIDGARGLWHVTNETPLTWEGFARAIARSGRFSAAAIIGRPALEMGWVAHRPRQAALRSERGCLLRPLDGAIDQFVRAVAASS